MINSKDITFCVKTFNRPNLLFRCLKSLHWASPESPIVVCDDSTYSYDYPKDILSYIKLIRFDKEIGISNGRNLCVKNVETQYSFILDDDHGIQVRTKWKESLNKIPNEWLNGIIGWPLRNKNGISGGADFICKQIDDGLISFIVPRQHGRCDVIINNFLAQTELLLKYPWKDNIMMHEHALFFFNILDLVNVYIMPDEYSWLHMSHKESKHHRYYNKRRNPKNLEIINEEFKKKGFICPPVWLSRKKCLLPTRS